jgi:dTDP-4-amino-4,6-dideoxygalactose transaminase
LENIQTKKYFHPPLHRQSAYRGMPQRSVRLHVTEWLTENVLTLPLYSDLGIRRVKRIASSIASLHTFAEELGEQSTNVPVLERIRHEK